MVSCLVRETPLLLFWVWSDRAQGKLPYDVQLRALEERRNRRHTFARAAAESFGSGSSSASKPPRAQYNRSGDGRSSVGDDSQRYSSEYVDDTKDNEEVQSPLKQKTGTVSDSRPKTETGVSWELVMRDEDRRPPPRKRKSKVSGPGAQTPDLNIPLEVSNAIVPAGLVNSRVSQLDGSGESSGGSMIETLKKQKRGNNQNARSTAVAGSSPRRAP